MDKEKQKKLIEEIMREDEKDGLYDDFVFPHDLDKLKNEPKNKKIS